MSTDELEAGGSGAEIRQAEEEVRKAQDRLRQAREQAAAEQDRGQQVPASGPPGTPMGAKGFGWFVAGVTLVLLGGALWIGLATHKTEECTSGGIGGTLSFCKDVTHAGQGAVTFLVLGGIGAVCLIAGYMARQKAQ